MHGANVNSYEKGDYLGLFVYKMCTLLYVHVHSNNIYCTCNSLDAYIDITYTCIIVTSLS